MIYSSYAEQKEELAGIKMVSCGHIFAPPKREIFRPNGRNDWLLFYVAKESETFFLPLPATADAGSVILFAPEEAQHHIYEGNKVAEFYYVHFTCAKLPENFSLKTSHIYSLKSHYQLNAIFEEIIDKTLQKQEHYELLCISELLRILSFLQMEQASLQENKKQLRSIAYAVQHMNKHCDCNFKLEEYASMCCMSKFHFLRTFKQIIGVTPIEYRNSIRIEHAKEMLMNSYISISEIGETLGYTSPSYFCDTFKKYVGISPIEFRRNFTQ